MPELNYEIFDRLFSAWERHAEDPGVVFSSDPSALKDCNAYRRLAKLGYEVLPLLKGRMHRARPDIASMGIPALIRELVGDEYRIPSDISGDLAAIRDYTIEWLQGRY